MRGRPLVSRPPWPHAPRHGAYAAALRPVARPAAYPAWGRAYAVPPPALPGAVPLLYHTDTHPESSRTPARLRAVREELARLPAESPSFAHAMDALRDELTRMTTPSPDAPIYFDIHALFFGCIRRLLRANEQSAALALDALSRLALPRALCDKHRALALQVLAAADDASFAVAWRAVRRLLPDAVPSETTPAVRALLRANRVGHACRIVQWHVRRFWRNGAPPPSHALMHNVMVQMRHCAEILPDAAPLLQASYTEALAHLGTLLRENYLPLPGAREDVAWLIKLLYTYDARCLPRQERASRAIQTSLPIYVERLSHGRGPPLSPYAYNALVQYTLHHAKNPRWCRRVLEHMTQERTPPLPPSAAMVTILLRQATRQRMAALGAYALELHAGDENPRDVPQPSAARLLRHVEEAVEERDTHRLIALLQYITALQLKSAKRPGGVRATSVAQRLFPRARRAAGAERPDARIGTAALTLAAKAGKFGLALRIWRWMKQSSKEVPISLPAATVLMQLFCDASRRPRTLLPRWASRGARRPPPEQVRVMALEEYAWLLRHWFASDSAPPDARFFRPLLRVLRRTALPHDPALVRVLADMAVLGLEPGPYPST